MTAGDHRPCEQAEITFGTVRACAMYAEVQAENYQYLQPMEVLSSSTVVAVPELGCSLLENGVQMAGNIAVITRGACTFTEKARNAQAAGAVAVIITDNRIQRLLKMTGDFRFLGRHHPGDDGDAGRRGEAAGELWPSLCDQDR